MDHETHTIQLWIDNDKGMCRHWTGHTREVVAHLKNYLELSEFAHLNTIEMFDDKEKVTQIVRRRLKDGFEQAAYEQEITPVLHDLLMGAMSEVRWQRLAEWLVDKVTDGGQVDLETIRRDGMYLPNHWREYVTGDATR